MGKRMSKITNASIYRRVGAFYGQDAQVIAVDEVYFPNCGWVSVRVDNSKAKWNDETIAIILSNYSDMGATVVCLEVKIHPDGNESRYSDFRLAEFRD